ncbi:hypothetical protein RvY_07235 [Ramazzottius varieornatus]|uniref:Uncharacterized protein n=1 Tax=Ramazzottius varieornatus TaxID=947166 RepID=A0A1D1V410_RAMVA|nr:hypothetical protein RvY_07235 [Ramazzottius varieornatus]
MARRSRDLQVLPVATRCVPKWLIHSGQRTSKGSPGSAVMIHRGVLDMQVAKHQMVVVGVESIYGGKQWDFIRRIV